MKAYTEEERAALAGLCNTEIKRWKAASESNPNMRYMVELMEIALAALTAEPVYLYEGRELSEDKAREYASYGRNIRTLYTTPPVAAIELPELISDAVNEAAWFLHDKLAEGGPLTGHQFNNLKGSFYEAMKVALGAPAEEKK